MVYKFLKEQGYSEEEILSSNLVRKKDNNYFDSFRNRLMFPIQDLRGRTIAFGGRVLDNSLPKYINSPDTIIYNKGRHLYGLNLAKNSEQKDIIIVEGYMDAVSLHQRGVTNAVASLGTALTETQGRLLRKYADKIIISYDSDGAGQAATLRGLDILKNLGCDVRVLQMKGAKDPDEYIIKNGTGKFNLLVQNAISLIEFKAKILKGKLNLENVNDKIKFLTELAKLLSTVDSKIEQEIYIDKIANEYKISKEAIYAEINKMNNKSTNTKVLEKNKSITIRKQENVDSTALIERENMIILLLMNNQIELYNKIKTRILPKHFKSEINKKILEKMYAEFEKGKTNIDLINLFEEEDAINRITKIMAEDYQITDDQKAIEGLLNLYEKERLTNRKKEIVQVLNNSKEDINFNSKELENELAEIIIKLSQIK